jgi:WS/DGAT/MGAT family acyltransferase
LKRDDTLPRRLSGADELMWRIEADPVLRSPILVIGLLDRAPSDADLRAALTSWQERFPRLRQRLAPGARLTGGARWVDCQDASLDFHFRRVRVPDPADLSAVLRVVEPGVTAQFDVVRPLWEFTCLDGLVGGAAAFALRFHHTVSDGVGGVDLAGQLFDDERSGTRALTGRAPCSPPTRRTNLFSAGVRLLPAFARAGLDGMRHPATTVDRSRRLAVSVARALAPGTPGSSAFGVRSLDRRLDVLEVPLAALHRAAGSVGGTVNDVFLAAIGGALHDYHETIGTPVAVIHCTMPISLRGEDDPRGGNRFAPARFALPIDDPDPVARARIAGAIVRRWRAEPALAWTGGISAALDLLPDRVVTRLLGGMLKTVDVDAVNVPGLRRPAYIAGSRVERLWAFAPPTGAALSVTLLSHGETGCVGLMCDRGAVPSPDLLRTCLEASLDDVLNIAPLSASMAGPA